MKSMIFMFAVKQHQRKRDGKFNVTAIINLFNRNYADYCMEAWVAWQLQLKSER